MKQELTQSDAEPRLSAAYWRLWWATVVNTVGDGAFAAVVPLLTVTITRDPRLVSVVSAATYLPWLLLSLPAGGARRPARPRRPHVVLRRPSRQ